jgi:hypothetical protein
MAPKIFATKETFAIMRRHEHASCCYPMRAAEGRSGASRLRRVGMIMKD